MLWFEIILEKPFPNIKNVWINIKPLHNIWAVNLGVITWDFLPLGPYLTFLLTSRSQAASDSAALPAHSLQAAVDESTS